MSASGRSMEQWSEAERSARQAFHEAEEGDKVLFGDRKQPLTVTDVGGNDEQEDHYLVLQGPQGGTYTLNERYLPTGHPDFKTEKGESANDLQIVDTGGGDDGGDGATDDLGGARYGRGAFADRNAPPERVPDGGDDDDDEDSLEVGEQWEVPDKDEEDLEDADDFVSDNTDGEIISVEEMAEAFGDESIEAELGDDDGGLFGLFSRSDDDSGGWTFVDELNAFGQDVPKVVNNWNLVDYGVVTEGQRERILVWNNDAEQEMLYLTVERVNGQVRWRVYQGPEDEAPGEPMYDSTDPWGALEAVYETLGVDENPDFRVIRYPDGSIKVQDNISDSEMGERVLQNTLNAFPSPPDDSRADQFYSAIGGAGDRAVAWAGRHTAEVGQVAKVAIVYGVLGLAKKLLGVGIKPVLRKNEVGVAVQYHYKGEAAEWLNTNFGGKMTIDPERFDLHEQSLDVIGASFSDAMDAAQRLGVEDFWYNPRSGEFGPGAYVDTDADTAAPASRVSSSSSRSTSTDTTSNRSDDTLLDKIAQDQSRRAEREAAEAASGGSDPGGSVSNSGSQDGGQREVADDVGAGDDDFDLFVSDIVERAWNEHKEQIKEWAENGEQNLIRGKAGEARASHLREGNYSDLPDDHPFNITDDRKDGYMKDQVLNEAVDRLVDRANRSGGSQGGGGGGDGGGGPSSAPTDPDDTSRQASEGVPGEVAPDVVDIARTFDAETTVEPQQEDVGRGVRDDRAGGTPVGGATEGGRIAYDTAPDDFEDYP